MKLNDILLEQSRQNLFHGTNIYNAAAIIDSNQLLPGVHWGKPNEPHGPRLTRDYYVATDFARWATINGDEPPGRGAVFELDTDRLRHNFKVAPYKDFFYGGKQDFGNEQEEVVITKKGIPNIDRYIVKIHIDLALFRKRPWDNPEEIDWLVDSGMFKNKAELNRVMDNLEKHPKLVMIR